MKSGLLFVTAAIAFFAAASNAVAVCPPHVVPCPEHWYFDCSSPCGGLLRDMWHEPCCNEPPGPYEATRTYCATWQKCDTYEGKCYCDSSCLPLPVNLPQTPAYYDNPTYNNVAATKGENDANVTLPAVLDWTQTGWPNGTGKGSMQREPTGPNSFVVQIDNGQTQLYEPAQVENSIYDPTTQKWTKVVDHDYFNSVTDGKPCFVNSSSTVTWHVKTCCNKNGTDCGPYTSFIFKTNPAPELIGVSDKNNPIPVADPDWNGAEAIGQAGTNTSPVDSATASVDWCAAKVADNKKADNQGQPNVLSYQMEVLSNEQLVIDLDHSYIPAKFTQYANWLKIDKLGTAPQETCHYLEKQDDGTCKAEVIDPTSGVTPRTYFSNTLNPNNDRDLFTKNVTYYVKSRSCFNNSNAGDDSCQSTSNKNYGQTWTVTTAVTPIASPAVSTPPDDGQSTDQLAAIPVGIPPTISWKHPSGANSYEYQIQEYDGTTYKNLLGGAQRTVNSQVLFSKTSAEVSSTDIEPVDLTLDTAYRWRVRSCWPSIPLHTNDCNETWSAWFGFRTTGRAPKAESLQPANNSTQVALPVILQWEKVPGALSYLLTVNDKTIVVSILPDSSPVTYQLTYPDVTQNQTYTWKVQTCADSQATNCGVATGALTFSTAALETSAGAIQPPDQATIQSQDVGLTNTISWDPVPGAQYYHFILTYADKSSLETNGDCTTGEKVNAFVTQSSTSVDNSPQGMYCLGNYKWNVQACMDKDCTDSSPVSADWTFTLAPGESAKKGSGFMVCGQPDDNPNTPYDEREACAPKHFFLVLERIINFFLFQLAFWLLPILGMMTAAIFYKSLGGPEVWDKVKSWWRAIGIGYALLFFAWILVGILLSIFGYTSAWWKI